MHGVILTELKKYVKARLGDEAWDTLREAAGLEGRIYLPVQAYPDDEAVALVAAASRLTGLRATEILEDYGRFIVPDLLQLYRGLLRPEWTSLDLIEHVEDTIHRAVRLHNTGATPPELVCSRPAPDRIEILYQSPRRMCSVGKGIILGIAEAFGETVEVVEDVCMLDGHPHCRIGARLVAAAAAA
jgi:hypothetical protein